MGKSPLITLYDASNSDRIALSAWQTMFRELAESGELISRLVKRDMASQFRQSFLGYVWIILPPVATTIVFTLLRKASVINVPMPDGAMPYALFVLVGTTVWGLFTQVTIMSTTSIVNAGNLVSKIYFPREVLVLSAVGTALINVFIRIMLLVLVFFMFGYAPHWQVIFAPILLLPLILFALGLGLFCAPANTMMHDMSRVLEFAFQFGMFLAPTIYPTPNRWAVDTQWQQILYWLHTCNPVTHYLHAIHGLIEKGTFALDAGFLISLLLGVTVFAIGWRTFHICEPLLAERL